MPGPGGKACARSPSFPSKGYPSPCSAEADGKPVTGAQGCRLGATQGRGTGGRERLPNPCAPRAVRCREGGGALRTRGGPGSGHSKSGRPVRLRPLPSPWSSLPVPVPALLASPPRSLTPNTELDDDVGLEAVHAREGERRHGAPDGEGAGEGVVDHVAGQVFRVVLDPGGRGAGSEPRGAGGGAGPGGPSPRLSQESAARRTFLVGRTLALAGGRGRGCGRPGLPFRETQPQG